MEFIYNKCKMQCTLPSIPFCMPQCYHPGYDMLNRKHFMNHIRENFKAKKEKDAKDLCKYPQLSGRRQSTESCAISQPSEESKETTKFKRISIEFQELMNRFDSAYTGGFCSSQRADSNATIYSIGNNKNNNYNNNNYNNNNDNNKTYKHYNNGSNYSINYNNSNNSNNYNSKNYNNNDPNNNSNSYNNCDKDSYNKRVMCYPNAKSICGQPPPYKTATRQSKSCYDTGLQNKKDSNCTYNLNYYRSHSGFNAVDPLYFMNVTRLAKIFASVKNEEIISEPQLDYLINFIIVAMDFTVCDLVHYMKLLNDVSELTIEVMNLLETILLKLEKKMGTYKMKNVRAAFEKAKSCIFKNKSFNIAFMDPIQLEGIFRIMQDGGNLRLSDYQYLKNFLKEAMKLRTYQKDNFLTYIAARGTLVNEATNFLKCLMGQKICFTIMELKAEIDHFMDCLHGKKTIKKRKRKFGKVNKKRENIPKINKSLVTMLQNTISEALQSPTSNEKKVFVLARRSVD